MGGVVATKKVDEADAIELTNFVRLQYTVRFRSIQRRKVFTSLILFVHKLDK